LHSPATFGSREEFPSTQKQLSEGKAEANTAEVHCVEFTICEHDKMDDCFGIIKKINKFISVTIIITVIKKKNQN
jgi:hypothetical protein